MPTTQHVQTFIGESLRKLHATFGSQCLHKLTGNKDRRVEAPAIGFDAACNIHSVAEYRELEPLFVADISLHDLTVVNTDRNADGVIVGTSMLLVQHAIDLTISSAHAAAFVTSRRLVSGGPKNAISPSPRNLSIDPLWENTASLRTRSSSRSVPMRWSGDLPDEYAVKPIMSANRTAAGWQRAKVNGM